MDSEKRKKVLKEVLKTLGVILALFLPLIVLLLACAAIGKATGKNYGNNIFFILALVVCVLIVSNSQICKRKSKDSLIHFVGTVPYLSERYWLN